MLTATQYWPLEWTLPNGRSYDDPFNEIEVDLIISDPDGNEQTVPAFWSGGQSWRVRFAAGALGRHSYRVVCSDTSNTGLHGAEGAIDVVAYDGDNSLLLHGPLRVHASRRYFEHGDGTPFFWLGDTWWMALCRRLRWPDEFRELAADRIAKGFSVVQVVAGLYPDMQPFDERGANEAGYPWKPDFTRIDPAYWDMADLRIAHLASSGLVPCIVGSWGYFMQVAGPEVLRKHWRYLVARYGAYPVIWCIAGEALMPYYLEQLSDVEKAAKQRELQQRWSELAAYVRSIDSYRRPLTIHPTRVGRDQVDRPELLDLDMLQTGHSGYASLATTVDMLEASLAREPRLPVLVGEANYEGILEGSREEIQRFLFWTCMLRGAAGHTYGANGLWQLNRREQPYGASPHGTSWGDIDWQAAYQLPGSLQLGYGKRLLETVDWWLLEPHPEWVEPCQTPEQRIGVYAAGIPGRLRILYVPAEQVWALWSGKMKLKQLEPDVDYRAQFWDPKRGAAHQLGKIRGDAGGEYVLPKPPMFQDWVILLQQS